MWDYVEKERLIDLRFPTQLLNSLDRVHTQRYHAEKAIGREDRDALSKQLTEWKIIADKISEEQED